MKRSIDASSFDMRRGAAGESFSPSPPRRRLRRTEAPRLVIRDHHQQVHVTPRCRARLGVRAEQDHLVRLDGGDETRSASPVLTRGQRQMPERIMWGISPIMAPLATYP